MLKRLTIDNLEISRENVSFLDLYCSSRAKFGLEGSNTGYRDMFDRMSQIVIGPAQQGHPLATPILLSSHTLIERTEIYGVNKTHLPDKVLSDVFGMVFMETEVTLPKPSIGEPGPKHSYLKFAWHPGQRGLDLQLELPIEVALEITKGVREYLPEELIKQVTPYYKIPTAA